VPGRWTKTDLETTRRNPNDGWKRKDEENPLHTLPKKEGQEKKRGCEVVQRFGVAHMEGQGTFLTKKEEKKKRGPSQTTRWVKSVKRNNRARIK